MKSPRMGAGQKLWAAGSNIVGGLSKTVGTERFNFWKLAAGIANGWTPKSYADGVPETGQTCSCLTSGSMVAV